MNGVRRILSVLLPGLCLLVLLSARPAGAQSPGDINGEWTASVLGQTVTASFNRQGDMLYGVIVIPDIGGGSNTYHVAGVVLGDQFAAQHASGHLLKGTIVGPNELQADFTSKSAPPMHLVLKRRGAP